jgi:hypothetical protein
VKINEIYYNTVFSYFAAIVISVPISFVMVVINLGFVAGFFPAFFKLALVSVAKILKNRNLQTIDNTGFAGFFLLERVKGIEPSYSAWEADVLPLNYTRGFLL